MVMNGLQKSLFDALLGDLEGLHPRGIWYSRGWSDRKNGCVPETP